MDDVWGLTPQDNVDSGIIIQPNIYVTDVPKDLVSQILGLQVSGNRAILAKYPNGNPETTFFPRGWILVTDDWKPPAQFPDPVFITVDSPSRSDIVMFKNYQVGIDGACSLYTPPGKTKS